jgi:hypothetical protein
MAKLKTGQSRHLARADLIRRFVFARSMDVQLIHSTSLLHPTIARGNEPASDMVNQAQIVIRAPTSTA